jgi:hypothetical protein
MNRYWAVYDELKALIDRKDEIHALLPQAKTEADAEKLRAEVKGAHARAGTLCPELCALIAQITHRPWFKIDAIAREKEIAAREKALAKDEAALKRYLDFLQSVLTIDVPPVELNLFLSAMEQRVGDLLQAEVELKSLREEQNNRPTVVPVGPTAPEPAMEKSNGASALTTKVESPTTLTNLSKLLPPMVVAQTPDEVTAAFRLAEEMRTAVSGIRIVITPEVLLALDPSNAKLPTALATELVTSELGKLTVSGVTALFGLLGLPIPRNGNGISFPQPQASV